MRKRDDQYAVRAMGEVGWCEPGTNQPYSAPRSDTRPSREHSDSDGDAWTEEDIRLIAEVFELLGEWERRSGEVA